MARDIPDRGKSITKSLEATKRRKHSRNCKWFRKFEVRVQSKGMTMQAVIRSYTSESHQSHVRTLDFYFEESGLV